LSEMSTLPWSKQYHLKLRAAGRHRRHFLGMATLQQCERHSGHLMSDLLDNAATCRRVRTCASLMARQHKSVGASSRPPFYRTPSECVFKDRSDTGVGRAQGLNEKPQDCHVKVGRIPILRRACFCLAFRASSGISSGGHTCI
jgi:hypothetical protein